MSIQSKAVLVKLALGMPGFSRNDRPLTAEVQADKRMGHDSGRWIKTLYPPSATRPLVEFSGAVRTYHSDPTVTLYWPDDGVRLLPTARLFQYTEKMRAFRAQFSLVRDAASPADIALVVRDMVRFHRDYGVLAGPNWDEATLTRLLCQELWNLPCHPDNVPEPFVGLPVYALSWLAERNWKPFAVLCNRGEPVLAEAETFEWLTQCAANRRAGAKDWKDWLADPMRWQFRHLPISAYRRIKDWHDSSVESNDSAAERQI